MKSILCISLKMWLLAVAAFTFALPAQAVRLDSAGINKQFVGVANYAFSYTSVPLVLTASCYVKSESQSWSPTPQTCSTTDPSKSDSPIESCLVDSCYLCSNPDGIDTAAYMSVGSMRKGLLTYYEGNHKEDNQGYCDFSIGTSSFSISFDFKGTGSDFSLSLIPGTSGAGDWITSGDCPTDWSLPAPPPAFAFSRQANIDPGGQKNLICNEDFFVSLAADPDVSNGAGISVTNNVNALADGVQEFSATTTATQSQASGQQSSQGELRQLSSLAADTAPQTLSSAIELRRFSSRLDADGRRWMATSDGGGEQMYGVLISGTNSEVTELAACQLMDDDGNTQPLDRDYMYDCDLSSLDGRSTRSEVITTNGSLFRAPPSLGPKPVVAATNAEVVFNLKSAITEFAANAQVASLSVLDTRVWHAQSGENRVVMIRDGSTGDVEVVTHSPQASSPLFMSCSMSSGGDDLNPEYLCQANLKCSGGSPCESGSWSAISKLTLPEALFKDRPCQSDTGVPALNSLLEVRGSGSDKSLAFQSTVRLPADVVPQPDKTGVRMLVEDARGHTVVDVDIPGGNQSGGSKSNSWQVAREGKKFTFLASTSTGATGPEITIEQQEADANKWSVAISGITRSLKTKQLAGPLRASFTLNGSDSTSGLCATTYGNIGQPRVTATPTSRSTASLEWTAPDMGGQTFTGYTVTWGYDGSSIAAGTLLIDDYDIQSTVIGDLGCNPNCIFSVTANALDVSVLPSAPVASPIPALGLQALILLILVMLGTGIIWIRRLT